MLGWLSRLTRKSPAAGPWRCSFCGKRREQVFHLIAGPGVAICGDCVALCRKIIEEARIRS